MLDATIGLFDDTEGEIIDDQIISLTQQIFGRTIPQDGESSYSDADYLIKSKFTYKRIA
jgi:hypothetical protein